MWNTDDESSTPRVTARNLEDRRNSLHVISVI